MHPSQIDLMERFPEHRFSCTQAQQYKWLEQLYPLLFEKLKAKVETGQFRTKNPLITRYSRKS